MVVKYILLLGLLCVSKINVNTYPIPKKVPGLLFYIQRSSNKNTIIYKANFNKDGMLDRSHPVNAYWIMYEEDAKTENLTLMEKRYAYGMISEACENESNAYWLKLVSQKSLPLKVVQKAPFKANIFINRRDTAYHLDHIFIQAENEAFWPKVNAIDLFMRKKNEGDMFSETIKI